MRKQRDALGHDCGASQFGHERYSEACVSIAFVGWSSISFYSDIRRVLLQEPRPLKPHSLLGVMRVALLTAR